ncbi:MAG: prepilin-type N-terminal cleavage/methylation domain-containing protein [Myxococcales bacterium]|nr:prepilin-type N-terminal cleavage/methylation domain-containing protein [Polyangiaceae bacterium]MDW8247886.1 prepilin-type N-terminal cleavage/methylation domain-containing protein [Myxococcales bacterium]
MLSLVPRAPALQQWPRPRAGVYRHPRGFTLLEVLAAVLVASLLAAAALPTMHSRVKDRRVQQFAQQIGLLYREARTRAIGRGTSHLVRFSTGENPQGRMDLFEAVQPIGGANNTGHCENLPLMGMNTCEAVNWGAGANSRLVTSLVEPEGGSQAEVFAEFWYDSNTLQGNVDVCFSPGGRSYIRPAQGGSFTPFNGVHQIRVRRMVGGAKADLLVRQVFLLPNGATRVETVVEGI